MVRPETQELLKLKWGDEQATFRILLWQRHGCPIGVLSMTRGTASLYCEQCGIDFGLLESSQAISDEFAKLRLGTRPLK